MVMGVGCCGDVVMGVVVMGVVGVGVVVLW